MYPKQSLMEIAKGRIGDLVVVGLKNGHIVQGSLQEVSSDSLTLKDNQHFVRMYNGQGNYICKFESLTLSWVQIYGIAF